MVCRGTYRGAGTALVRRRMRQDAISAATAAVATTVWRRPAGDARRTARGGSGSSIAAVATAAAGSAAGDGVGLDNGDSDGSDDRDDGGGGGGDGDVGITDHNAVQRRTTTNGAHLSEADAELQGVDGGAFDNSEYDDEYGGDDWDDGSAGEDDDADEADLAAVVQQLAEMATLGMGCEDEIYPDPRNLRAFYELESAYFEEMPFRVQL
ncbi:hypothetical protein VOLCADRAFT_101047 [Volvox carteri f. nagariensis]|uniref:Uncharacterized protein n=1 Tax=Volvox carteri f. nagariensis TaxID=3068 RepID=D8ULM2_VOLCA|nr:uncharacterized protein VOLCADRAFT_101047 [Volvox carteri f. nagariensis]EFJ39376.1 hypothetical protein VOLCADRAFT_101047 [Volvox carteri f. nagariensis]|eukprot:XP_002959558.1 hypothetical protein VOLCADRAFT_101047 [Volvox carteri f. nagariensis]